MKRALLLPTLALVLAGAACGRRGASEAPEPPVAQVRLATLQEAGADGAVAATLAATRHAVLSTRLAASIKAVHVQEGQHVAAGQLLVSLADDDLQGGLRAAETAVATAAAQVRRLENLAKVNAAVPAEMDLAQVQLAQARAALAAVQANLAYTRITAPFAGVVQARKANAGDFAGPGQPLVELDGTDGLEFTASVSEAEAAGLRLGMTVPFEAEGRTGTARVTALAQGQDPVSHRGALRAQVVSGGEGLASGAFGRLKLPARATGGGLAVPRSALVQRGELTGVFVARGGRAELRWLNLGDAQGDRVAVRAGLTAGEAVVDRPGDLRDGQKVEVAR